MHARVVTPHYVRAYVRNVMYCLPGMGRFTCFIDVALYGSNVQSIYEKVLKILLFNFLSHFFL